MRRLILLSYFRAETEKKVVADHNNSIIFAIEEPETAQHPDYGHMTFGHPYRYAKELNPRLLALCESQDISLGWTVIDFGNARLAWAIYEQNF